MAKKDDPMKTDDKDAKPAEGSSKEEKKEEPPPTVQELLKAIVSLIESSVKAKDTRMLAGRLLRQTATIRKMLSSAVLHEFISKYLVDAESSTSKAFLLSQLDKVTARAAIWLQLTCMHVGADDPAACRGRAAASHAAHACMHPRRTATP